MCFICGINTGTVKYITERRQLELVCIGCDDKEIEVSKSEEI